MQKAPGSHSRKLLSAITYISKILLQKRSSKRFADMAEVIFHLDVTEMSLHIFP